MLLRPKGRVNYAALHGHGRSMPPSMATVDLTDTIFTKSPKQPTMAAQMDSPLDMNTSRSSIDNKQVEIDAIESQLEILSLEEKLAELKLELSHKQARAGLQQVPQNVGPAAQLLQDSALLQAIGQAPSASAGSMPAYRAYLGLGAGYGDCQYYDILQFVDAGMSSLGTAKGRSALGKMTPGKISPEWEADMEYVSPMAWSGASVRILSRLIDDGALDTEGIMKYLSYMLRISQLSIPYTWKSTLLYDRRCRIMQAATKDGWDVEPSGVASTTLVKKKDTQPPAAVRTPGENTSGDSKRFERRPSDFVTNSDGSRIEICRQFNSSRCGFNPCRFVHICNVCHGAHPAQHHSLPAEKPAVFWDQPPRPIAPPWGMAPQAEAAPARPWSAGPGLSTKNL